MTDDKVGRQDRKDTRAAKAAERADTAGQVWEEVKVRETARDDQIVRLKAERLAKQTAADPFTPTGPKSAGVKESAPAAEKPPEPAKELAGPSRIEPAKE